MMSFKMSFVCLFFASALLASFAGYAQSATSQETLSQYLSDLQKKPDDSALREKIIKLVQTMKPAPAIPEEARHNYLMAKTLYNDARNIDDYNAALSKYRMALLLAPWWGEAYQDMGMAYEAVQQYDKAIIALKLNLVANPASEKSRKTLDEIYILEAKQEEATKNASAKSIASKQRNADEAWLKSLEGARFIGPPQDNFNGDKAYIVYYIEDGKVHLGWFDLEPVDFKTSTLRPVEFANKVWNIEIQNRKFIVPQPDFPGSPKITVTISDDGQLITFDRDKTVYRRAR